jgi:hypothetical protein
MICVRRKTISNYFRIDVCITPHGMLKAFQYYNPCTFTNDKTVSF